MSDNPTDDIVAICDQLQAAGAAVVQEVIRLRKENAELRAKLEEMDTARMWKGPS